MTAPGPIEGFERHHRQKGDRKNWHPTNILYLTPEDHRWAEAHPDEARELGWSVSRYEDPAQVPVVIPKTIHQERPKREKKEKARNRVNVQVRVPKDVREDGAGLFDELVAQCRERLEEGSELATGGKSSDYIVLMAVMHDWLTN